MHLVLQAAWKINKNWISSKGQCHLQLLLQASCLLIFDKIPSIGPALCIVSQKCEIVILFSLRKSLRTFITFNSYYYFNPIFLLYFITFFVLELGNEKVESGA